MAQNAVMEEKLRQKAIGLYIASSLSTGLGPVGGRTRKVDNILGRVMFQRGDLWMRV